jgi:Flp pilus assembly protein TadG
MISGSARVRRLRERADCGAVALEFALILPLFLMLVFGVVTVGLAYNDKLSIANAVREAGRMGANTVYTQSAPTVITPTQWADSVQQRVQQVYFNAGSTLSTSQICVKLIDSSGGQLAAPTTQGSSCGTEPSAPATMAAGTCAVKVWVQKPATIRLAVLPDITVNIGARSVSYYGRAAGSCPGA